jgi:hypothetical protein
MFMRSDVDRAVDYARTFAEKFQCPEDFWKLLGSEVALEAKRCEVAAEATEVFYAVVEALERRYAAALRAAARVPEGYVRQGTRDMPLLGTLPVTADGCVAGDCAEVFVTEGEDEPVAEVRLDKSGYTCEVEGFWPVEECYSTREAAEAARGAEQP